MWELTFAIHELFKELLKAFRGIHQNPTVGEMIQRHQDIFGVPPNIHDLKQTIHLKTSAFIRNLRWQLQIAP